MRYWAILTLAGLYTVTIYWLADMLVSARYKKRLQGLLKDIDDVLNPPMGLLRVEVVKELIALVDARKMNLMPELKLDANDLVPGQMQQVLEKLAEVEDFGKEQS
jgi:hypothetical protein